MQCLICPGKANKGRAHRDVLALERDASPAGTTKGVETKREALAEDKRMDFLILETPKSHPHTCSTQGLSAETTPPANRLL